MSWWPPVGWPHPPLVVGEWRCCAVSQACLPASTLKSASLSLCSAMVDRTAKTALTRSTVVRPERCLVMSICNLLFNPHHIWVALLLIESTLSCSWVKKYTLSFGLFSLSMYVFVFLFLRHGSNQRLSRVAKPDQLLRGTRFPWWQYNRCPRPPYHQVPRWHSWCWKPWGDNNSKYRYNQWLLKSAFLWLPLGFNPPFMCACCKWCLIIQNIHLPRGHDRSPWTASHHKLFWKTWVANHNTWDKNSLFFVIHNPGRTHWLTLVQKRHKLTCKTYFIFIYSLMERYNPRWWW